MVAKYYGLTVKNFFVMSRMNWNLLLEWPFIAKQYCLSSFMFELSLHPFKFCFVQSNSSASHPGRILTGRPLFRFLPAEIIPETRRLYHSLSYIQFSIFIRQSGFNNWHVFIYKIGIRTMRSTFQPYFDEPISTGSVAMLTIPVTNRAITKVTITMKMFTINSPSTQTNRVSARSFILQNNKQDSPNSAETRLSRHRSRDNPHHQNTRSLLTNQRRPTLAPANESSRKSHAAI